MSEHCCDAPDLAAAPAGLKRALVWVIAINAVMFVVEMTAGGMAQSQALKADALDFLGDSLTYALSLAVLGLSLRVRATAALIKGGSLAAMGLFVLGLTLWRVFTGAEPEAPVMGAIGLLALAANLVSVLLLLNFRDGDSNIRSVWLCSRNDAIGNIAVMAAAALVYVTGSSWPDLLVAGGMATLFLHSATKILLQALHELSHLRAIARQDKTADSKSHRSQPVSSSR